MEKGNPHVLTACSTITVIRHAEKPAGGTHPTPPHGVDAAGEKHPDSLTPRGWQRAGALAVILGTNPPAPMVRPTVLISPDYGAATLTHRTSETIRPLAEKLGVTTQHPRPTGHEHHVVKHAILPAEGHVLVCWEHHHIPDIMAELAHHLGIAELPPIARTWPEADFDSVIVVTVGEPSTMVVTSQNALSGDAPVTSA